jgi:hypothetical protein
MSFVDGGYQGDEAQRAAFETSHIAITVVKLIFYSSLRLGPCKLLILFVRSGGFCKSVVPRYW